MDDQQKACLAIILALSVPNKRVLRKRKRWVKEWISKRKQYTHLNLLNEVKVSDPKDFNNYFRMNFDNYNTLLSMVAPLITKANTNMRESISANERLAVTLRYLATGRTFEDLKFSSIISPTTISLIVMETCQAIITVLNDRIQVNKIICFCYLFINTF